MLRARVSLQKNQPREAVKDLQQVLDIEPNSLAGLYYMADANLRVGQVAQAREFAAALAHAERLEIDFEGFLPFIEAFPGGLKGVVAAERDARRPEPRTDTRADRARSRLRAAHAQPLSSLAGNDEFTLVLVRRDAQGRVEPVSAVTDLALLEKALRRVA